MFFILRFPPILVAACSMAAADVARADEPAAGPPAPSWATLQAAELSRQAREHAARGDRGVAISRYLEALKLDATYASAYLELAGLHEANGDIAEAERTCAVGLEHVQGFAEAHVARAHLRAAQRRGADAITDLEAAVALRPEALPLLRELAAAYVAARALPAALAVTRRIAAVAEAQHDPSAAAARVSARALAFLVGEADPVSAGRTGRGAVRHALWLRSRRR